MQALNFLDNVEFTSTTNTVILHENETVYSTSKDIEISLFFLLLLVSFMLYRNADSPIPSKFDIKVTTQRLLLLNNSSLQQSYYLFLDLIPLESLTYNVCCSLPEKSMFFLGLVTLVKEGYC